MYTPVRFKNRHSLVAALLLALFFLPLLHSLAETTATTQTQTTTEEKDTCSTKEAKKLPRCSCPDGDKPLDPFTTAAKEYKDKNGEECYNWRVALFNTKNSNATGDSSGLQIDPKTGCYVGQPCTGAETPTDPSQGGVPLASPDLAKPATSDPNDPNYVKPAEACVGTNCAIANPAAPDLTNPAEKTGTLLEPGMYDPGSLGPSAYSFNEAQNAFKIDENEACNSGICVSRDVNNNIVNPPIDEAGTLPAARAEFGSIVESYYKGTDQVGAFKNFLNSNQFTEGTLAENVQQYTGPGAEGAWKEAFGNFSLYDGAQPSITPQPTFEQLQDAKYQEALKYLYDHYKNTKWSWKDEDAAAKLGMTKEQYVFGGLDPKFAVLAAEAGKAMEADGIPFEVTSGFRDDYRQGLITGGTHAHVGHSWHGGSKVTEGYGDGKAIDISGAAAQKWIDDNGAQYGLARPYGSADAPHVALASSGEVYGRKGRIGGMSPQSVNGIYQNVVSTASVQPTFWDSSDSLCSTCAGVGSTPASIPNQIAKAPTTPAGGVQYPPNVVARVGNAVGSMFGGGGLFGGASGGGSNPFGSLFGGGSSGGGSNSGYNPYQNQNTYQNQIAQSREYSNRLLDSLVAQQRQQLQQYYVTADTSNRNLAQLKTLLQQQRQQLQQFAYQYPDADQNFIRSMDRAMAEYIQAIEQLERVQANNPTQTNSASQVQQQINKLLSDINRLETETESNVNTSVASDLTVAALRANKTLTGEYRFRGSLSRTLQNASDTSAFTDVGNYFGSNVAHELLLDLKCDGTVDEKLRFNTPYYSILPRSDGADVLLSEYLEVPEEGLHCFAFAVDVDNLIPEQNENNNQSQWREFIAGAAAETEGNPTLPPLNFDVAVYNSNYSSIIRDWTDADITMGEGQQLVFRWDAPEYQECVPLLSSVTPGSADNTSPVERNTLSENVEIHEHTGYYEIRCSTEGATRVETIHVKVE